MLPRGFDRGYLDPIAENPDLVVIAADQAKAAVFRHDAQIAGPVEAFIAVRHGQECPRRQVGPPPIAFGVKPALDDDLADLARCDIVSVFVP